jgi:hypothetical protein
MKGLPAAKRSALTLACENLLLRRLTYGIEAIHPCIIRRGRLVARLPRAARLSSDQPFLGLARAAPVAIFGRGQGRGPKTVSTWTTQCGPLSGVEPRDAERAPPKILEGRRGGANGLTGLSRLALNSSLATTLV